MARKSFIKHLSADRREELDDLIDQGAMTVTDLTDWVNTNAGGRVASRSAVGRYVKQRGARQRAVEMLTESAVLQAEGESSDEAVDLVMELATLRLKEAKILERLRELKAI